MTRSMVCSSTIRVSFISAATTFMSEPSVLSLFTEKATSSEPSDDPL